MTPLRRFLLALGCCLTIAAASAQSISGYTTLDIDPTSNMVTATCETDLDADTDSCYDAFVSCQVKDGSGRVVSSGNDTDVDGGFGFAAVTLTFNGVSGTNYTATGTHSAYIQLTYDLADTRPGQNFNQYDDVLNFSQYAQANAPPQIYNGSYIWRADGPDTPARNVYIKLGNTTESSTIPPIINVSFTGQLTPGDGLRFKNRGNGCPDQLGLVLCPLGWSSQIEVTVVVDDAARWKVSQTLLSEVHTYTLNDHGQAASFSDSAINMPDSPKVIQQQSGTRTIFYIDDPGDKNFVTYNGHIDSVDSDSLVQNFRIDVCSLAASVCGSRYWYAKLVVDPGSLLNTSLSGAAYGTAP